MVFRKFEYYRFLAAINESLHVVARIDLAKGSFIKLLVDHEAVVYEEAFHLLDDWDRAMFLTTLFECVVHFVLRVHLFYFLLFLSIDN